MTTLKLIDFVSVMVLNKRIDPDDYKSQIIFSHKNILNFLETHKEFVRTDEVVKIFILSNRFRLTLYFMQHYNVPFQIDFFCNALESNSYDIAFYLLKVYEE